MEAALACLVGWVVFVAVIFGTVFDYYKSSFFSFGPSPNLYILGINYLVDTWPKYCWIIGYTFGQSFIVTFAGDNIYPWINAVILNKQAPEIYISKTRAMIITNVMYSTFSILTLFSTGINMSQIGFFLASFIGSGIAGIIQSFRCIKNKKVVTDIELDNLPL
jgi:hypothetical protein